MNQQLDSLLKLILQSEQWSDVEKKNALQAMKQVEHEMEHKNRELEIETALEKVRAVAMNMKEPADMLEICRIISKQLQILRVKEIRNIQTAVFYESKGTYLNYEYFNFPDKTTITEVDYNSQPDVAAFANQMLKAPDTFFTKTFTGKEVKEWIAYQEKAKQFIDPKQYEATSIHYYFYSIGTGALGVSTYAPLSEEEINLFKRFRNVFELAYRRYADIEKAQEQAREAKMEASLERVRAVAMSMMKSDELLNICESVFKELRLLGFSDEVLRNVQIVINNDDRQTYYGYQYSEYIGGEKAEVPYDLHPVIKRLNEKLRLSKDAFADVEVSGMELEDWKSFVNSFPQKRDEKLNAATELHYYFYSVGIGALGISTFKSLPDENLNILQRLRNVFNLSYQRYSDIAQAEAQAREAQIEASLERVRAKAMAMHNSSDLSEAAGTVFTELNRLGINPIRTGFVLLTKDSRKAKLYPATSFDKTNTISFTGEFEFTGHPVFEKQYESWQKKENYFPVLEDEVLKSYYKILSEGLSVPYQNFPTDKKQFGSFLPFTEGFLFTWSEEPYSEKEINILNRFKVILDLTIRRYQDLKNAEAQAREAKIEAALERVRSKAMAMHKSNDLNDAVAIVFEEFDKLKLGMLRCGIGILHKEKRCADVWTTTIAEEGHLAQVMGDESIDIHPLLQGAFDAWERQKDFSYLLEGEDLNIYYNAVSKVNFKLPDSQSITTAVEGLKQYYYVTAFEAGNLYAFRETPFSDEAKAVMKRFAGVFNLTYKRFLDIQKAEAQAIEAQLQKQLIENKHREITENISYALRIQTAILPAEKLVNEYLQNAFVLYLPKDVVAGDFYWMARVDDVILFSANDCTGHGVSGAMVSVICHNALNMAIREYNLVQPSLILDKVAELVEENFTQSEDKIQDGMDTSLCALHLASLRLSREGVERGKGGRLQWAGANNPLWIIRNNEIIEYKPDKQPIGKYENRKPYTNHEIQLQQGDNIYIFSDGYQDQFGGEKGKKLTKKGLRTVLLSIQNKNMQEQHEALFNYHHRWKGKEEQVDDICVIGVRV